MIVDGRQIAEDIYRQIANELSHLGRTPHLTVVTSQPDFATQRYLALKKRKAAAVGIDLAIVELPATVTTEECVTTVSRLALQTDGLVVQLPVPAQVDVTRVLGAIPVGVDVDAMNYSGASWPILPPVVGAIAEIADREQVVFAAKQIVILGEGRLVGTPVRTWVASNGWSATVVTESTPAAEHASALRQADIIISGTGRAHLITPDRITPGVILFDAGTSEANGELVGDVHPSCSAVARLFTPVPGGIGPITVAVLLRNCVLLMKAAQNI